MVPEGWSECRLVDILDGQIKNGYSPNSVEVETGYWVLGLGALGDDSFNHNEIKPVIPTEKVKQSLLQNGDFLISRSNTPDKVGRSARFNGQVQNCSYPDLMMRFRVDVKKANPSFIEVKLKSWFIRSYYKKCSAGSSSTMVKINKLIVEQTPLLVPPLPEQKKIARILSIWGKTIETVEKLIENSKAQKKALMQQLLTRKRRRPGFEGEWKIVRLDDVLNEKKRKGKIVPTNEERRGVAYIGSTSFCGDFGIYTDSSSAVICSSKDILVLWDGENAGKVTTGLSGAVSSTVVRYSINKSKANSRFITYNLLKDNYKVRAIREGSGIPHMPGDFEHWYHIDLPSLKEQQKIASVLTTADNEIETLQQKRDGLKQEKKALMQQLLTGKRRVRVDADG